MMKDHTFDRSVQVSTRAAQPHFDDERTVQSARPVVPLERINARLRHRRQWFLGGAFAVAIMLGATTALLTSYLKLRNVSNSATETSKVEMATAPLAIEEPLASEIPPLETSEELLTTAEPRKEPVVKPRTVTKRDAEGALPQAVPQLNEDDELDRIREAILYDRWQERRERRATRRERRMRQERDNHRDLSNLDEIFEGSRRRP